MTFEEKAEEYIEKNCKIWEEGELTVDEIVRLAYLAGAEENGVVWHKITDWKDQEQFPDNICEKYLVYINLKYLKIKQYAVCTLDITEGCRQFYFDDGGEEDVDSEDVIAWCEIPQFQGVAE